jgi:hypothetical protein
MAQSSIQQLIINSPYEEPSSYWAYHRKVRFFTQEKGRRPAGYVTSTPGAKSFDDPGVFRELPLVNFIRRRVAEWRKANYPGVTAITRRLLEHWQDLEQRDYRRFFFCQLEAIETLIWLSEASPEAREGIALPGRRRPVRATVLQDGHRVGQDDRHGHAGGLGNDRVAARAQEWLELNQAISSSISTSCPNGMPACAAALGRRL